MKTADQPRKGRSRGYTSAATMSRAQAEQSSESPDRQTNLCQIHERLIDFITAHTSLSKATLRLADSIVDFYAPEVNNRHMKCSNLFVWNALSYGTVISELVVSWRNRLLFSETRAEPLLPAENKQKKTDAISAFGVCDIFRTITYHVT